MLEQTPAEVAFEAANLAFTAADKKARKSRKNVAAWEARNVAWEAYEKALAILHKEIDQQAHTARREERMRKVQARRAFRTVQFELFS